MLLFLIRHGDPIYEPDQLTGLGQRQAEAVGRRLSRYGIDKVFSSTSTRAYQTALPTAEICKKEITQLDWCHEDRAWEDLTVVTKKGYRTWVSFDPDCAKLFVTKEMRAYGDNWYDHPALSDNRDRFKRGMERIDTNVDAFLAELGFFIRFSSLILFSCAITRLIARFAYCSSCLSILTLTIDK